MSKLQHTPGPWKILDNGGRLEKVGIANPDKSNWFIAEEILPDDARLIAAAPDMLEALITYYLESEYEFIADIIERATGLKIEEVLK